MEIYRVSKSLARIVKTTESGLSFFLIFLILIFIFF